MNKVAKELRQNNIVWQHRLLSGRIEFTGAVQGWRRISFSGETLLQHPPQSPARRFYCITMHSRPRTFDYVTKSSIAMRIPEQQQHDKLPAHYVSRFAVENKEVGGVRRQPRFPWQREIAFLIYVDSPHTAVCRAGKWKATATKLSRPKHRPGSFSLLWTSVMLSTFPHTTQFSIPFHRREIAIIKEEKLFKPIPLLRVESLSCAVTL